MAASTHYRVEEEIARGGMGAVMCAVDKDIRREVAVKFLLNQADARQKARFVEEAQITGQLEHPNIVPIHQLGVHADGRCFFSMKMVKGRSLGQILDQLRDDDRAATKTYTLGRLLSIFINICHAVNYAHARNVIHRDLKPANVMVGDFGEVYVMDWGLAKVLSLDAPAPSKETQIIRKRGVAETTQLSSWSDSKTDDSKTDDKVQTNRPMDSDLTQEGAILGTPAYMPPEQALGNIPAIDQRSDIYSLGAILYEILTLTPPVGRGGDVIVVLMRAAEGQILAPEQRAPERARQGNIPPELSAIALKALAKERDDRYQTVGEFQRDIELFLEGRSVSAKQDTTWEMFKKLVKRNKGVSAATGVALVVLIVVVGFFLRINYTARVRAEAQEAFAKDQQKKAEKAKKDLEDSQRQKEKTVRESLPAFIGAARQLTNEGQIGEAQKQVEVALTYDPQNAAAHLLKGQILLARKDVAKAQAELTQYLQQRPKDQEAQVLLKLSRQDMQDPVVLFALTEALSAQKLYGLTIALTKDIADGEPARLLLLKQYQKQLDATWGLGKLLTMQPNKQFHLNLRGQKQVTSLQPLKDMRLHMLQCYSCPVRDLEPLRGMPLTFLDLNSCARIEDFRALEKMPLAELDLGNTQIADLGPLRGMPLEKLGMYNCVKVADLGPLQGMPLKILELSGCPEIADLRPLQGMSLLTQLKMRGSGKVADLEPLRGLPLQALDLIATRCRSLDPLRGMPLKLLRIGGAPFIEDISPLKDLPLTQLDMGASPKIHDLTPLAGMKLQTISLTPKYIQKGLDVLRPDRMPSLKTIAADADAMPADVFWTRYDAGGFRK